MTDATLPSAVPMFCWADLATTDETAASSFYKGLFGWTERRRSSGSGRFATLEHRGRALASFYRLTAAQVEAGVPSHWLPYVATADLEGTLRRAVELGADVLVAPQRVPGIARIAVLVDPTGALLGLWQSEQADSGGSRPSTRDRAWIGRIGGLP